MKGMHKISRGKGFRGAISYVLDRDAEHKDNPGQIIGGNMSGENERELAAEFGVGRELRSEIDKPVWHNSLRLPAGEHISKEKLADIADDYMKKNGIY